MVRPRDERQKNLFRLPLGAIFYLWHPLVLLVEKIDGGFFERQLGSG